jgi:hypothetical protein
MQLPDLQYLAPRRISGEWRLAKPQDLVASDLRVGTSG